MLMQNGGNEIPYRWHIFLANLNPVIGSEQGNIRPVLVISEETANHILPVINILPITSKKSERKLYPNEVFLPANSIGLPKDSIVLCFQIRTIDKTRLEKELGIIDDPVLQREIIEALSFQLGMMK